VGTIRQASSFTINPNRHLSTISHSIYQVKQLDWVERAWPRTQRIDAPKEAVLLTLSLAGYRAKAHLEKGGASAWFHVVSGQVVSPISGSPIRRSENQTATQLLMLMEEPFGILYQKFVIETRLNIPSAVIIILKIKLINCLMLLENRFYPERRFISTLDW
jgi:hypothetical protein